MLRERLMMFFSAMALLGLCASLTLLVLREVFSLSAVWTDPAAAVGAIDVLVGDAGTCIVWVLFPEYGESKRERAARQAAIPNPDDVLRLQGMFNLDLPEDYRKLLVCFPVRAFAGQCATFIWDDVVALIERNLQLHAGPRAWPRHLAFIGDDGAGEEYALDLRGNGSSVHAYWLEHDAGRGDAPDEILTLKELARRVVEHALAEGIDPVSDLPPPSTTRAERLRGCVLAMAALIGAALAIAMLVLLTRSF